MIRTLASKIDRRWMIARLIQDGGRRQADLYGGSGSEHADPTESKYTRRQTPYRQARDAPRSDISYASSKTAEP